MYVYFNIKFKDTSKTHNLNSNSYVCKFTLFWITNYTYYKYLNEQIFHIYLRFNWPGKHSLQFFLLHLLVGIISLRFRHHRRFPECDLRTTTATITIVHNSMKQIGNIYFIVSDTMIIQKNTVENVKFNYDHKIQPQFWLYVQYMFMWIFLMKM